MCISSWSFSNVAQHTSNIRPLFGKCLNRRIATTSRISTLRKAEQSKIFRVWNVLGLIIITSNNGFKEVLVPSQETTSKRNRITEPKLLHPKLHLLNFFSSNYWTNVKYWVISTILDTIPIYRGCQSRILNSSLHKRQTICALSIELHIFLSKSLTFTTKDVFLLPNSNYLQNRIIFTQCP